MHQELQACVLAVLGALGELGCVCAVVDAEWHDAAAILQVKQQRLTKYSRHMQVTLRWRCADKDAWQEVPMARAAAGQPLFSVSITAQLRCEPWDGTEPAALLQVSTPGLQKAPTRVQPTYAAVI